MAKPRRLKLLVTLVILITATSVVGHFAADAICVARDAGGGAECTSGNVADGRSGSASPVTADLHGSFNLPSDLPALSPIALAFVLVIITLTHLPYFLAPSPPPPKLLP